MSKKVESNLIQGINEKYTSLDQDHNWILNGKQLSHWDYVAKVIEEIIYIQSIKKEFFPGTLE